MPDQFNTPRATMRLVAFAPLPARTIAAQLPERLLLRLQRLDAEQLQIVEIVAAAIERGAR